MSYLIDKTKMKERTTYKGPFVLSFFLENLKKKNMQTKQLNDQLYIKLKTMPGIAYKEYSNARN